MDRKIVIMGVAGSGKTTVGEMLAAATGFPFIDGDSLHPAANIDKMSRGIPLCDDDRWPWLDAVGGALRDTAGPVIIGCSALKRAYRDRIRAASGKDTLFVHLAGNRALIGERMRDDRNLHVERWCSHRAAEQWLVALVVGVRNEGDACGE